MLYHHTPRFQRLLLMALRFAAQGGASDSRIKRAAGLSCSRITIQRFRTQADGELQPDVRGGFPDLTNDEGDKTEDRNFSPLNSADSRNLWNYLVDRGYVETVMKNNNITKAWLSSPERVAGSIMSFYEAEDNEVKEFINAGLIGKWFCYKPSITLGPNYVVKSRFEISEGPAGSFEVTEEQRYNAIPEQRVSGIVRTDKSTGFGFSRYRRLWFILREESTRQPRILCFADFDSDYEPTDTVPHIVRLYGHVMEGSERHAKGLYSFPIGLVSKYSDETLWCQKYPNIPYSEEKQIDIFPVVPRGGHTTLHEHMCLDDKIMRHIKSSRYGR